MSRRDSKVSLNNRQNDALTEFENFKKKFLLANKHITKLNSTLSVRVEELQAQISTLYVENLRLRASEIALAAQLKKEQEKSRKILADAEAATSGLSKHLGLLRQSFGMVSGPSPNLASKPVPKARRPVLDPNASPVMPRLSRAPNIAGIIEDDELASEEDEQMKKNSLTTPSKSYRSARDRETASSLPVDARRDSTPPLPAPLHVNFMEKEASLRRKGRRQSGLLSVNTNVGTSMQSERPEGLIPPRAASPAFGSPIRRQAGLAEDDEERRAESMMDQGSVLVDDNDYVPKPRKEKKEKKSRQVERELTPDDTDGGSSSRTKERKRRREDGLSGLKDVTNSPRGRDALPPLDINTSDRDRQRTPDDEGAVPTSAATSAATSRTFLSTFTTPATTPQVSQLPSPRSSSPIPQEAATTLDPEVLANGRERRVRKSVNYAEPKLNTKMRKPDPVPPPVTSVPKKRISSSLRGDETGLGGPSESKASVPKLPLSSSSSLTPLPVKRGKSRPYVPLDDDDDESDGAQADAEYGFSSAHWVNVDSRRRSTQSGSNFRTTPEVDDARRHSLAA
ncbi:hypothetical protein BKA82DRAFT_1003484 [Pisolithus tinctorius]|uniref:Shugoshin C-terminal domain-containing protein n=1 Tax=Pisolithus tinctorius Marx 270 TaxID=870435 RepID=A0A0C3IV95_PISTI|nr:hypothetical protein BKA82DRAFT_1003484 [Pisolithus tinctorius]KIO00778.1 hypothetical protein M404DRAFT_1003484 [Pisolithus tinctorius Marx 270]